MSKHRSLIPLLLILLFAIPLANADTSLPFKDLTVQGKTYANIKVIRVSPTALTITHDKGLSQIPLAELEPRIQAYFGYNPDIADQHTRALEEKKEIGLEQADAWRKKEIALIESRKRLQSKFKGKAQALYAQFKQGPQYLKEIDLRPRLKELDLFTSKSQGMRPSCSTFAVLTAVEFEAANQTDDPKRFSEEYLLWATLHNRSLGKTLAPWSVKSDPRFAYADTGFTLQEVFEALKEYGILYKNELPYTWGVDYSNIQEPSPQQVATAQDRFTISPYRIPGTNRKDLVNNIVHLLNEGIPVVIGARFPLSKELSWTHILKTQAPYSGHAVTLVGYKSPHQEPQETLFIFKNSWGPRWGIGGYGFIDYNYLVENISSAYFIQMEEN